MERSSEWCGQAWCDLMLDELAAKSAQHRVTGRAVLYMEAGLPVDRVLDALKLTEPEFSARLAAWSAWREENRRASEGLRITRVEP